MATFRSLFSKIFGVEQGKEYGTDLEMMEGYRARFTNFNGRLYETPYVRMCIDAIARNGAKLSPKHIRAKTRQFKELDGTIQRLIGEQPNIIDNAYSFYYKVISQLYLNNNAFIYIQRDQNGTPIGLYPLRAEEVDLLEYREEIYIKFKFSKGKFYVAPLKDDVIHLKRFYCQNDIMGGDSLGITKLMSLRHIMDEGIVNAIKTTQSIKGVLKTTKAMLKPEDVKKMRDAFVQDFMDNNRSGIGGLDAMAEFVPIKLDPMVASDSQDKANKDDIMNYFGVSEKIIQSTYTEDEWNAFYESVLEGIALQMSLEFTNKLFTITERFHGNKIIFEANRLQYASNQTKISIIKNLAPLGALTINEMREILNMAPVEDGDRFLQSLNYINTDIADDYQGGN